MTRDKQDYYRAKTAYAQAISEEYQSLAQMWAKTLAYKNCGKLDKASEWAQRLVDALRCEGVEVI